jgi:2-polyprenyl-3-methyl-5-hydroxy-6-metoxy-1,4-benzoquinol methylase
MTRLAKTDSDEVMGFASVEWGDCRIESRDLDLLSRFTNLSQDECLFRLASYRPADFAREWRERKPQTPAEIRAFYGSTDLYIWELLVWNGSSDWLPYRRRLDALARLWPPGENRRALDYGAGIGTAALDLGGRGYRPTIADIPGQTLEFACARMQAHDIPYDLLPVRSDVPSLTDGAWSIVVCFDVLEHLPNPAPVAARLVRAVPPGGGLAVVASFDVQGENWPHHLAKSSARFAGHRWELYFQSLGTALVADHVYRRLGSSQTLLRSVQYQIWRSTGLLIRRLQR